MKFSHDIKKKKTRTERKQVEHLCERTNEGGEDVEREIGGWESGNELRHTRGGGGGGEGGAGGNITVRRRRRRATWTYTLPDALVVVDAREDWTGGKG